MWVSSTVCCQFIACEVAKLPMVHKESGILCGKQTTREKVGHLARDLKTPHFKVHGQRKRMVRERGCTENAKQSKGDVKCKWVKIEKRKDGGGRSCGSVICITEDIRSKLVRKSQTRKARIALLLGESDVAQHEWEGRRESTGNCWWLEQSGCQTEWSGKKIEQNESPCG